jgi:chromosome segregation ATPase
MGKKVVIETPLGRKVSLDIDMEVAAVRDRLAQVLKADREAAMEAEYYGGKEPAEEKEANIAPEQSVFSRWFESTSPSIGEAIAAKDKEIADLKEVNKDVKFILSCCQQDGEKLGEENRRKHIRINALEVISSERLAENKDLMSRAEWLRGRIGEKDAEIARLTGGGSIWIDHKTPVIAEIEKLKGKVALDSEIIAKLEELNRQQTALIKGQSEEIQRMEDKILHRETYIGAQDARYAKEAARMRKYREEQKKLKGEMVSQNHTLMQLNATQAEKVGELTTKVKRQAEHITKLLEKTRNQAADIAGLNAKLASTKEELDAMRRSLNGAYETIAERNREIERLKKNAGVQDDGSISLLDILENYSRDELDPRSWRLEFYGLNDEVKLGESLLNINTGEEYVVDYVAKRRG